MKTAETAVQKQGRISSFINSILKPKNSFAILLAILMAWLLAAEIYNKFQQPVDTILVAVIMAGIAGIIMIAYAITENNTSIATVIAIMIAVPFSFSVITTTLDPSKTEKIVQALCLTMLFGVVFFITKDIWVKGRKYFPAYILLLTSIFIALQW